MWKFQNAVEESHVRTVRPILFSHMLIICLQTYQLIVRSMKVIHESSELIEAIYCVPPVSTAAPSSSQSTPSSAKRLSAFDALDFSTPIKKARPAAKKKQ